MSRESLSLHGAEVKHESPFTGLLYFREIFGGLCPSGWVLPELRQYPHNGSAASKCPSSRPLARDEDLMSHYVIAAFE
jgi:hypothetical protein